MLHDRRLTLLAGGISAIWILALGAYGIGYFQRLATLDAASQSLPTLDLLFFAFAVVGPIAMLWMIVVLLNRASHLTDVIAGQSESALALAATVGNLQESVDALAEGTTGRLEGTLTLLEERSAASISSLDEAIGAALDDTRKTIRARGADIDDTLAATGAAISTVLNARVEQLDRTLEEASTKLDNAVLDSVILVNSTIRDRSEKFEAALETQREAFGKRLDGDAAKLAKTLEQQAAALHETQVALSNRIETGLAESKQRLDSDADALAETLQMQAKALHETQLAFSARIEAGLTDSKQRLDGALDQNLNRQEEGFSEARVRFEAAVNRMSQDLAQALDARTKAIDADLSQNHARLSDAIETTSRMVKTDIGMLLANLHAALDDTRTSVAANPPATADQLGALLGETANAMVGPERQALIESVKRISDLEEQARKMLIQIDRTSRLNPMMDAPAHRASPEHSGAATLPELPFAALPRNHGKAALNWNAVVHTLEAAEPAPGMRRAVEKTLSDPQIAAVVALRGQVAERLSADKLYLEDVTPEHADAALWAAYGRGARGDDIAALAGIEDEIALAITRKCLRKDPDFRALAMRYVDAYTHLVERAVAEIGSDPRLIEMAESTAGRAFLLLASLTGAFAKSPQVIDPD